MMIFCDKVNSVSLFCALSTSIIFHIRGYNQFIMKIRQQHHLFCWEWYFEIDTLSRHSPFLFSCLFPKYILTFLSSPSSSRTNSETWPSLQSDLGSCSSVSITMSTTWRFFLGACHLCLIMYVFPVTPKLFCYVLYCTHLHLFHPYRSSLMNLPGAGGIVTTDWWLDGTKLIGSFRLTVVKGQLFTISEVSYKGHQWVFQVRERVWSTFFTDLICRFHTPPAWLAYNLSNHIEHNVTLFFCKEGGQSFSVHFS